jgi:predicted small secreted protein
LLDTDGSGDLTLTTAAGDTTGFKVTFTVVDNNSCKTSTDGNEISSAFINVYRSGVTSANCDESANYDVDKCYPDASTS